MTEADREEEAEEDKDEENIISLRSCQFSQTNKRFTRYIMKSVDPAHLLSISVFKELQNTKLSAVNASRGDDIGGLSSSGEHLHMPSGDVLASSQPSHSHVGQEKEGSTTLLPIEISVLPYPNRVQDSALTPSVTVHRHHQLTSPPAKPYPLSSPLHRHNQILVPNPNLVWDLPTPNPKPVLNPPASNPSYLRIEPRTLPTLNFPQPPQAHFSEQIINKLPVSVKRTSDLPDI